MNWLKRLKAKVNSLSYEQHERLWRSRDCVITKETQERPDSFMQSKLAAGATLAWIGEWRSAVLRPPMVWVIKLREIISDRQSWLRSYQSSLVQNERDYWKPCEFIDWLFRISTGVFYPQNQDYVIWSGEIKRTSGQSSCCLALTGFKRTVPLFQLWISCFQISTYEKRCLAILSLIRWQI